MKLPDRILIFRETVQVQVNGQLKIMWTLLLLCLPVLITTKGQLLPIMARFSVCVQDKWGKGIEKLKKELKKSQNFWS